MDKLLEFLKSEKVCSLSVMLSDGNVHGAAMHFSHKDDPLELIFSTDRNSIKAKDVLNRDAVAASVVVGFDDWTMQTVQMDGIIRAVTDPDRVKKLRTVHYAKITEAAAYKDDPDTLFLLFTPRWWRFSDYTKEPPVVSESVSK